jgi:hypothetical protein
MNRTMRSRLAALEGPAVGSLPCIEIVFVEADGTKPEPFAFHDTRGNSWSRGPEEALEEFRERCREAALAASPPRCGAMLIPCEG